MEQERNRQRLRKLLEKPGNGNCADCGAAGRLMMDNTFSSLDISLYSYSVSVRGML